MPMTDPHQQLLTLRGRIDAADDAISQLLIERIAIIREVAVLKAAHWPNGCHIRPAREGQMHEAIANRFTGTDVDPAAALAIWRQLIGSSTSLESPLIATALAHQAHHGWLVREYFGVNAGFKPESSIADMLDNVTRGEANIAILPAPGTPGGDWWVDAGLFSTHKLSIFATLPVTTAPLPDGASPALALATVECEPSGNDISYVALTTKHDANIAALAALAHAAAIRTVDGRHHLLTLDGFIAADAPVLADIRQALGGELLSLTLLGAHPRAISL